MLSRKTSCIYACLVVTALAFGGCAVHNLKDNFISKNGDPSDVQDRQQSLTRQDFRDLNKADKLLPADAQASASLGAAPIPDIAEVLAAPHPPKIANTKLITISVTEDVPLRDVLFELGRLANVDIEVGTGLERQGINLRVTDKPFNEVMERIADLGSLRYSVQGNVIRVERDTPYIKNYPLDFLNMVRSSNSSYTLSTSVLSGGGSSSSSSSGSSGSGSTSGGGFGTSGSSSSIVSQAESDLWNSLQASITEILSYHPDVGSVSDSAAASSGGGSPAGASPSAMGGPPAATNAAADDKTGFVINRQAGILSVNASQRQHEMIQRYLTMMSRNVSAQVLIEAKIVEVSLSDQFLSGIDWTRVISGFGKGGQIALGNWQPVGTDSFNFTSNGAITLGIPAGELSSLIKLTQQFGTTRTLSSPRLSAINNQQAVLTFAENKIFFNCTLPTGSTSSTISGSTTTTGASVDCQPSSVPLGIILSIMPSINLDAQEVTLAVRPTLTSQVDAVPNPGIAIAAAAYNLNNLSGTVPEIQVREIDSVMKVKSGGVMVIGGLMEDNTITTNKGIPGVDEVPFLGNFFKSRDETSGKRELIIFIKATIVNADGSSHPIDRAIYNRYTTDPRPAFPAEPPPTPTVAPMPAVAPVIMAPAPVIVQPAPVIIQPAAPPAH